MSAGDSGTNTWFGLFNDRATSKEIARFKTTTNFQALAIAQDNTANQKLLTGIIQTSNVIAYKDGTIQDTTAKSGSYTNSGVWIAANPTLSNLGDINIQEIIIFPSDKTADLTELHAEINAYYTIY